MSVKIFKGSVNDFQRSSKKKKNKETKKKTKKQKKTDIYFVADPKI